MKHFTNYCFAFLFLISAQEILAQKTSKLASIANSYFLSGNYTNAYSLYKQLVIRDTSNFDYLHCLAICSFKIYDLNEAVNCFENVIKKGNSKKYVDDLFYYAQSLKMIGKYKEAKKNFEKYYRRNKKNPTEKISQCLNEIEGCNLGIQNCVTKYRVHILDSNVNSVAAENSPFLLGDTLYFSTQRDTNNFLIFGSLKSKNSYGRASPIEDFRGDKSSISNLAIYDGKAYFTVSIFQEGNYSTKIYSSDNTNHQFKNLTKLEEPINFKNSNSTQPCIGRVDEKKCIFFVSNRYSSFGEYDIFQSKINEDGTFEEPINIGDVVNTKGNEITPFYCNHCQALFFSSDFHPGYGGFDIFKSEYRNGAFSKPINLGKPINSSLNDLYFFYNEEAQLALFSSNRKGTRFLNNEFCCNDIFSFTYVDTSKHEPIRKVQNEIKTIDSTLVWLNQLNSKMPLQLFFDNDEPDSKSMATSTTKNFAETVSKYSNNESSYKSHFTHGLVGDALEDANEIYSDFFEDSVRLAIKRLDDCAELIWKLLNLNVQITISVKGFCSPLASTDYNKNLAKRRICSVVNYFKTYKSELFKNALQEKKFLVDEIEIGELLASDETSDNPNDITQSVYSMRASLERKISILKAEIKK